jgi:hypothetical protein
VVIKSRRVRSAGHVACIGKVTNANKILAENLRVREHFGCLGVNARMILKEALNK